MSPQQKMNDAILYALKCGCLFPVSAPRSPYRVDDLIRWGAMRNLHSAIADFYRAAATETPAS